MNSPIKYAGAKRWLVPRLLELYQSHRRRRLVEPFVGGMSVALGLQPDRALLSDKNQHLVNFYRRLQNPSPFTLKMENDRNLYYAYRDCFNNEIAQDTDVAAELYYYLNKNCYNGLSRFNASGKFNTPFGKYKTVNYRRDFSEYAAVLQKWEIWCCTFDEVVVEPDDFVYL